MLADLFHMWAVSGNDVDGAWMCSRVHIHGINLHDRRWVFPYDSESTDIKKLWVV
jgi:hypothetical protein